jgi:hypothetical protein
MNVDCVDFLLLTTGELELPEEEPFDLWNFIEQGGDTYEQ